MSPLELFEERLDKHFNIAILDCFNPVGIPVLAFICKTYDTNIKKQSQCACDFILVASYRPIT
jgi:hypothetical protein